MAKEEILIRCINSATQKVGMKYPAIANNKLLMRTMGWVISDPNYDGKMSAIKNKTSFSENGQAKTPVKESFATPIEQPKVEPKVEQPKNEIETPAITGEKVKRVRRTKAQMKADKADKANTNKPKSITA